jgi:hypothetical protein
LEGFVILMMTVEFSHLKVATLDVDAELLVFLSSWLTVRGGPWGPMVIALDVFETGSYAK